MYISGPTGTGKTFTVQHFFSSISHLHRFELLNLNCVLFKMEKDILRFIFDKLTKANKQPNVSNLLECIENVFSNAEIPIIIVLDEIDYMKSKNNSFLYKFFEWPTKYSQVACIGEGVSGISNSLDLTERILPKLKLSHSPVRVIFSPYTRIEIQQILVNKLSHIGEVDMQAIELCSRKIASMTGDIRFALQIGRQMLFSSNEKENKYCERVLGTLSNIYDSPILRIRLPIQQKIILAVMLNLSQKYSTTAINKDLFEKSYHNGCKKLSVVSMNANDLSSSLLLLESQSVIQIKSSHYQLLIDAGTAAKIISDSTLISQFFLN
ncbi:unnamed protein product [Dracunculus medinensis]|uniref:AAA domain-containing protein n=1 Tax=Dracunculus medinensis TaxID=318479 RepID=A0A0N4U5V9_DRAME|nr:unnamed protein product [Dracunculus medinensis]